MAMVKASAEVKWEGHRRGLGGFLLLTFFWPGSVSAGRQGCRSLCGLCGSCMGGEAQRTRAWAAKFVSCPPVPHLCHRYPSSFLSALD